MHNPHASGEVSAVAVGPGGALYTFHRDGNMGGHKIKVSGRDGKHQRMLLPFPADIAADKVKALGVFQTEAGDLVPHIHNWETLSFYPDNVGVRGRDMPEYICPAVDSNGSYAGELAVDTPQVLGVDPADGTVYVCVYTGTQTAELVKFSGLGGKEFYRLKLLRTGQSPKLVRNCACHC